ncbi:HAMP domain-containing histidine kinase [Pelagibacterium sp. 26DY04]|uniref:HAMP domain-containing sensor histidine kinase n=1 Tax=Pelagibacterium sp. 26DY04 TaxID=2967130 RepID=UPI002815FFAC|nr:HAMP domain-containing sensor histidine kinase [Pelagibacterium sp. 26DY04]WMT88079.1 HAMP domain-containing histidine kinase [Pelagibacterium sp. 26DY04]
MKKGSIAFRLFWLSAGWLVVALVATAFLLTELYSQALDRDLNESLDFQISSLVGQTLEEDSPASSEIGLSDTRFSRPTSGWYWQVRDEAGALVNFSPSMVGTVLPELAGAFNAQGTRSGLIADDYGQTLRAVERWITLDEIGRFVITVTGNYSDVEGRVDAFRGQAIIVLAVVGIILAAMSGMIARFALRPIERLREAIEAVREGDRPTVEGAYPQEIAPLAEELNELLRSNTQIIARAQAQVGNLAHGLKTPLAVLRNEADGGKSTLAKSVLHETDNMSRIVATYLDKARLAARSSVVGKRADTRAVLERLGRVMAKLNKQCDLAVDLPKSVPWFRGDESDLEEMAGNLLDNACKWARSEVRLSARESGDSGNRSVTIVVEDNGPGLTDAEAEQVLRRGVRLDEKTPGSGLGLDIVKELVDIYGGDLTLSRSALGGLNATLRLPAARTAARTQG